MRRLLFAPRSLVFTNVDAALEICAILDDDPLRGNIARKHSRLPELDAICADDVAIDSAVNHHFLGIDVRANASVWTNREVMIVQFDAALYFPVDIQIFTAGELALYYDGFADMRHICTTLLAGSIRVHGTDLLTSLADPGRRSKIRAFALRTQDSMSQYAKYEAVAISNLQATGVARFAANYTEQIPRTQRTVCIWVKKPMLPEQAL